MTDFEFKLMLFGDVEAEHTFRRIGNRANDLEPVWRSIFDHMVDIMGSNIVSRGARTGSVYEELKIGTLWEKFREGSPSIDMPLVRFGDLFGAVSTLPDANNATQYGGTWARFEVTGEVGKIAGIHQHGSPDTGLPARPFFRFTPEDRKDFIDEMHHFIFRGRVRGFVDEPGRPVRRAL